VAGHLLHGACAAAFLSITIVARAGGCSRSHPTPEGATAASKGATAASDEVSPALIGKQITIRGKLSWGKPGPCILLDNQQLVYLVPRGSFNWGKRYSEMEGKLVAATGTLRFCKAPPAPPEDLHRHVARLGDFFYFEMETTQLRLIGH